MAGLGGGAAATMLRQIQQTPYGRGDGDAAAQRPVNVGDETVLVRVRNLSALRPRKHYIAHVGIYRGAEEWADEMAAAARPVNLEMLYAQFLRGGRDVNPAQTSIAPVNPFLTFDGRTYLVPAKDEHGKPAPWVEVPEGVYDLYFGNHKRLSDPLTRSAELERVNARRKDYCVRDPRVKPDELAKQGEQSADRTNPFAFLVFERRVVQPSTTAVDLEAIFAGTVMEI